MINPRKKRQGFPPTDDFPTLFDVVTMPESNKKWVSEFSQKAQPCLKKLYDKYKIPPSEVVEAVTLCRFSPVPATYPAILRNARRRETLAAQFEKLANKARELAWLDTPIWNADLFSNRDDYSLDGELDTTAAKIRRLKSLPGRPEDRMLGECAQWLAEIFQKHAGRKLYQHISDLLALAFPGRWVTHWDGAHAVKDMLKLRRTG